MPPVSVMYEPEIFTAVGADATFNAPTPIENTTPALAPSETMALYEASTLPTAFIPLKSQIAIPIIFAGRALDKVLMEPIISEALEVLTPPPESAQS